MPKEIVQWHSTLSACCLCFCTVNVSNKHAAEVHSRPSLSLLKWVTYVWADFTLERGQTGSTQAPTLSLTDQRLLARKLTCGTFFACSLQAVLIKWDCFCSKIILRWGESLLRADWSGQKKYQVKKDSCNHQNTPNGDTWTSKMKYFKMLSC